MQKVTALTLLLGMGWLVLVVIPLRGGLCGRSLHLVGDFAHS
jgi:hypothetical protein